VQWLRRLDAGVSPWRPAFYNILLTAIELIPGGSGYFTCIQNMKLVTTKFKSGGLHEKHVVALGKLGTTSVFVFRLRETRKTCVEVAGRRTFRIPTSSQQSGI
jgi:hypothetical protein